MFNVNEKEKLQKIKDNLYEVEEIFRGLSDNTQDNILKYHREGYSLNHCIRWGLRAVEELTD